MSSEKQLISASLLALQGLIVSADVLPLAHDVHVPRSYAPGFPTF